MPKKKFEETAYNPFAALEERGDPDGGVAEAATETAPATPRPTPKVLDTPRRTAPAPATTKQASAEALARQPYGPAKRFKVTQDEDAAYEELLLRLRSASGSKLDFSVLSRVLWAVAQHGEAELVDALKKASMPKRPSKNDPLAMAEYEAAWMEVAITAFRKMSPAPK